MTDRIDNELRNVQLPPGMLDRLRAEGKRSPAINWRDAADADIDAALNNVSPPDDFADQVRASVWQGVEIDRQLRDVEVSGWFLARLRSISRPARSRWRPIVRNLSAAAALLMVFAAYGVALLDVFASIQESETTVAVTEFIYEGPMEFTPASQAGDLVLDVIPAPPVNDSRAEEFIEAPPEEWIPQHPEEYMVSYQPPSDLLSELVEGYDPHADWVVLKSGVFGSADSTDDDLPEFLPPLLPPATGVEAPLRRDYDRRFLLRNNAHPIVTVRNGAGLAAFTTPLVAETPRYDRLFDDTLAGRPPTTGDVRAEEFINAIRPPLAPARPKSLRLSAAIGPSPFHRGKSHLLLLGAAAGESRRTTPATHLTVAIDTSASMSWNGRLRKVRAAIERVAQLMSPDDRLTLIQFNDRASMLLEMTSRDDLAFVIQELDSLQPTGGTSLAAGVQLGVSASMHPQASELRKQLVVVTDDDSPSHGLSQEMVDMFNAMSRFRLNVRFVHLGDDAASLQSIADFGVTVNRAKSKAAVTEAVVSSLTGASAQVAQSPEITIKFDDQQVAAWRLIGHAPEFGGEGSLASREGMSALDTSCVLYEVWLTPDAGSNFARATLAWRSPHNGQTQRVGQSVSVSQLASRFADASPSLQAASLAAEAAENLRESPFATSRNGDIRGVLKQADQVSSNLANQREFQQFVNVLKSIQQLNR